MQRKRMQPQMISEVLGKASKKYQLDRRLPLFQLEKRWAEITGEAVCAHSCPSRLQGSVLFIKVEHPSWMQELTFLKPKLLEKIHKAMPSQNISHIRFELGEVPKRIDNGELDEIHLKKSLSDDELEFIDRAAEQIADPEIQEIARRAMSKGFRRKRP